MIIEPTGTNQAVTGAIRQAARMTGADFKYLLATAQVESNLNPNAQASTSSARGLFQFTEQTWLTTLKEQGAPLGYGPYASAISRQASGDYVVSDPRMAGAVMGLRSDPAANALMAGAFTKVNTGKLAARLGRDPTEGELYIAHFLGATGASRLIGFADTNPNIRAAAVFPGAARANSTIFYDGRGHARSTAEVYHLLVSRYDVARGVSDNNTATAAKVDESGPAKSAFAPDTAGLTETYAAAARMSPVAQVGDIGAVFHGLFHSRGEEPVASLVNSLWTSPQKPDGAAAPATARVPEAAAAPVAAGGELGLFQDQVPDARALFRGRV
jgi:transglycosylase-like protein with SLT domain